MPEDEFRTDLRWPTDPLGERHAPAAEPADPEGRGVPHLPDEQDSSRQPPNPERHEDLGDRTLERLDSLQRDLDAGLTEVRAELAVLQRSLVELLERPPPKAGRAPSAASLEPLVEELAQVREELVSLRRRVSLRAGAEAGSAVLSDEQLERIARTVADLLSGGTERSGR